MRLRLSCLLAAALLLAGTAYGQQAPRNVILLIPDGFGPASATMARDYLRYDEGRTALAFDSLQTGAARTHAADSRITDSAAGATAYSTGHKTNNGYVATDTLERP
ncbi:MAG: alkaline phosphatase, partial [Bacteroidetes bacterium QS_1_65_9]